MSSVGNALLLLLLIAGHSELLVTGVNRVYSLPIAPDVLHRMRRVHDVLMPGFAILLVWIVGFKSPGVLVGGRWSELTPLWQVWCGVSLIGLGGLVFSTLRWQFRRRPAHLVQSSAEVIDVVERIGHRPVGEGLHRRLVDIPLNEQLTLEISRKTFQFHADSGRPVRIRNPDADVVSEFSILHLSDLHFTGVLTRPFFELVFELAAAESADLAVFTGDLIDDPALLDWIVPTFGKLSAPHGRYFILGNHDGHRDHDPDLVRSRLEESGWTGVGGCTRTTTCAGRTIEIAGDERPWFGSAPEFTGADGAFRLLMSHTPDNLPWAARADVRLMLSGHNHGGQVALPLIGPVYSPSRHGVRFASGEFLYGDTTLHVSRGISAVHPLRWCCRPELTKLIVQFVSG